ncbi:MAG: PQQ-binding-like beta-propeller repeat protein [Pirellulaceae bacterium]
MIAVLIVIAICVPNFEATAQFGGPGRRVSVGGKFIEPDRMLRQQISDAQEAIAASRFSDAIIILGELLSRKSSDELADMAGQDFFLKADEATLANESILREAETMLGQLPAKGIETYQLRYGSLAKASLDEAVKNNDWQAIAQVSRQYLHTDAGRQATLLIGYQQMLDGLPMASALTFDRLYQHERIRNQIGNSLIVALAGSWNQAGRSEAAVDVMLSLQADGNRNLSLAGREVSLPTVGADASAITDWLNQHFPSQSLYQDEAPIDQPVAGGGPARTGYRGAELPMRNERWMKQTTWSVRQEEDLQEFEASRLASGAFPIPTWQPIVVGDTVLAKTTEGMVAIDFETGKYIWEYPWFSDSLDGTVVPTDEIPDDDQRDRMLKQRVWNDLPFGRISSDGTRAYMLMNLGEVSSQPYGRFGGLGVQGLSKSDEGTNTLVALDIATEGKLAWTIGGEFSAEPRLDETFFLGPPLPVDGALYVLAEQKADLYLLCLNPEDGRLRWRQQLIAVETGSVQNDPIRRIGGAIPAYADGTIVCPTGHGALVAFDLATRTFRWGFRYARSNNYSSLHRSFSGRNNDDLSPYMSRWNDGTPVIYEGRVLFTPIEGDRLYALDLKSGDPLWSTIPREDWQYLRGVAEGRRCWWEVIRFAELT